MRFSFYKGSSVPRKPSLGFKRDPAWKKLRQEFIDENGGACAVCGLTTNLEVHHIVPLHKDRSRELDKTNLIVLCENKSIFCHFVFGHLMHWWTANPTVIKDAKDFNEKIKTRDYF